MGTNILTFIGTVGYLAAPFLLAALGGLLCEKSGVVNLALEGFMISGAFAAATAQVLLFKVLTVNTWIIALIAGGVLSLIIALLFAVAVIKAHTDQTITGIAINLISLGLTIFLVQIIFNSERTPTFVQGMTRDPWLHFYPSVYLSLIVFLLVWLFLRSTNNGMRLQACGEHPEAVESAGLKVRSFRYFAILSSGLLAGLGGACLVLTQTTQYSRFTINGQGFIALSAVSFGRWQSPKVLLAALVFGLSVTMAIYSTDISWFQQIPAEVFSMFPYVANIVALILFSRSGAAPAALGANYSGR